jgi:hypothetical protein
MQEERARGLLYEEPQRLERLLASVDADHERVAPADEVAGDLTDGAAGGSAGRPTRQSPASSSSACKRSSGLRAASPQAPTAVRS